MEKEIKKLEGRLVILTRHLESWYKELNSQFNIPIANRLAKIVKILDWDTAEGKVILAEREKNGKWTNLKSEDFRFILKIYYPELKMKDKKGIAIEELVPQFYPGTENLMFFPMPDWMLKDLIKEERNVFKVEKKEK